MSNEHRKPTAGERELHYIFQELEPTAVLVPLLVNSEERFGIALISTMDDRAVLKIIAILPRETDDVRMKDGKKSAQLPVSCALN